MKKLNIKTMEKALTIIGVIAVLSVAWNVISGFIISGQDSRIDEIIFNSNVKIQEHKRAAIDALKDAKFHSGEAEKYKTGMEAAESSAAEKDKKIKAEREKRKEVEGKLDIILADPPCKDLDFEKIDFEGAKLKIMALCKIGEYQIELNKSYKTEIDHLSGIIVDKNKALFSCRKMASEYQKEAAANGKAAANRLNAINEFENVTIPALEKKVKILELKKIWKYVKWFLYGAGTGAAGYAIFGRK